MGSLNLYLERNNLGSRLVVFGSCSGYPALDLVSSLLKPLLDGNRTGGRDLEILLVLLLLTAFSFFGLLYLNICASSVQVRQEFLVSVFKRHLRKEHIPVLLCLDDQTVCLPLGVVFGKGVVYSHA